MGEVLTQLLLGIFVVTLVGFWAFESWQLKQARKQIPIRIHVNGTRGKSSVTRLIAGALRGGGLKTAAKTTGTLPRLITEQTVEEPIVRLARTNILEQTKIIKKVAGLKTDAMVIECMALQPEYQYITEHRIVQATIGVITNIRPDHLDVMGPTVQDVAWALAGSIPQKGYLVTAERNPELLSILRQACEVRGTQLIGITEDEVKAIDNTIMAQFGHYEHRENVALALRIAHLCNITTENALRGMVGAKADPGALSAIALKDGHDITFVNGFAANDPNSSQMIWDIVHEKFPPHYQKILLFNLREDRADRSRQLCEALTHWIRPSQLWLMGTGTTAARAWALRSGIPPTDILDFSETTAAEAFEKIKKQVSPHTPTVVVGIGNVAGAGLELVELFRKNGNSVAGRYFYPVQSAIVERAMIENG